ncbi:MAG: hypothetical protein ACLUI7_12245 [Coprococcus sp.]
MWRGCLVRIYQLFVGHVPTRRVLEAAYAFGVAAGILLFLILLFRRQREGPLSC